MNIILYDNQDIDRLNPFSTNHSPLELRLGAFTNFERIKNAFNDEYTYTIIVRKEIEELVKNKFSRSIVNPELIPQGLCISSSAVLLENDISEFKDKKNISSNGNLISFYLDKDISLNDFNSIVKEKSVITIESKIKAISNIWDIFDYPEKILDEDFNKFIYTSNYKWHPSLIKINEEKIFIGDNSNLKAGIILDASTGPIIIDQNVVIDHHVSIEGPAYIGKGSFISAGTRIKKNTILGPVCKVGGEISHSNFLGYSNKVHEGFLGHSYVGEWINIGAGTNSSNLKNNYSTVKVKLEDKEYDTKQKFIGSFIGDYTRIAIGIALNTGTYIGFGSNLFNHNFNCKYIPMFSWGNDEKVEFDKFIESISKMKERRNRNIKDLEIEFIKKLYHRD